MAPIPGTFLKLLYSSHVGTETSQAGLRNTIVMWYLSIINDTTALELFLSLTSNQVLHYLLLAT